MDIWSFLSFLIALVLGSVVGYLARDQGIMLPMLHSKKEKFECSFDKVGCFNCQDY